LIHSDKNKLTIFKFIKTVLPGLHNKPGTFLAEVLDLQCD